MSILEALCWGIDFIFLAILTWQGFALVKAERTTERIAKDREAERKAWRETKRKKAALAAEAKALPAGDEK